MPFRNFLMVALAFLSDHTHTLDARYDFCLRLQWSFKFRHPRLVVGCHATTSDHVPISNVDLVRVANCLSSASAMVDANKENLQNGLGMPEFLGSYFPGWLLTQLNKY